MTPTATVTDPMTEAILDATRASVLDFGIRRTSLTDVARRAGVSRMTVYRRYPDVDAILRDLMTREFGVLLQELFAHRQGTDGRARTTWLVVDGARRLRDHPLLQRIVAVEPEVLLPYLLGDLGETQRHALALLTTSVTDGQADGSIRAGDPRVIAAALLLLGQSFLSSQGTIDGVAPQALDDELARLIHASLIPEPPA